MHWSHFALRIGIAILLGAAIGLERQWRQRTAGLRTNTLVCLGAALFVSMAPLLGQPGESARIAAQVVSGIGFLGGGVILREGFTVRGMNTAATLWCSAAVGLLSGLGLVVEAALATAAVLLVHLSLRPVARYLEARLHLANDTETCYQIRATCERSHEAILRGILLRHVNSEARMTLHAISTAEGEREGMMSVVADIFATERNDRVIEQVLTRLSIEPGVSAVRWERVTP
jgi:putative Mg2+ transporter-C (MgtC) family protein